MQNISIPPYNYSIQEGIDNNTKNASIIFGETNNYLLIQFNRYKIINNGKTVYMTKLPESGPGSKPLFKINKEISVGSNDFVLAGYVLHSGTSLYSGHYVCNNIIDNNIYNINDDIVTKNDKINIDIDNGINIDINDNKTPYFILYRKKTYNPPLNNYQNLIKTTKLGIANQTGSQCYLNSLFNLLFNTQLYNLIENITDIDIKREILNNYFIFNLKINNKYKLNYKNKYLKYKQKYLQLKRELEH